MEGVKLACLYTIGCLESRRRGTDKIFSQFIKSPSKSQLPLIVKKLMEFEPYFFYRLIAENNNLDSFQPEVVKAYWLGNELLKEIDERIIEQCFSRVSFTNPRDLERIWKIVGLINRKPHHNFSVIWTLKKNKSLTPIILKKINECLIRSGVVMKVKRERVIVKTKRISFNENFYLENSLEELQKFFLKNLKKGDLVSFHFRKTREKIFPREAENLIKITKEAISFLEE